jgi:arylsulfatase A-like enzyme
VPKNLAWIRWLSLGCVSVISGLSACSETRQDAPLAPENEVPHLVRLIDQIGSARIESPLLAVETGGRVLETAPGETLWTGALDVENPSVRVSVAPRSGVRVEIASSQDCNEWSLTEFAGDTALRKHRPLPGGLALLTTPRTDAVVVTGAEQDGSGCDEPLALTLLRVAIDDDLELALLKSRDLAEGADPELGIAKHGQLLPVPDVADAHPPFDHNFDFRDALYAPTPTDLSFDTVLPIGAQLRFSIALGDRSQPGDAATFSVLVGPPGAEPTEVYRQTISLDGSRDRWHWHDVHLDLAEYGHRRVTLTLRTRASDGGRAHALWGHPIVDGPWRPGDPPSVILIAVDTLRADRVGPRPDGKSLTPQIDSLAADGVRYDQAISASDWTRPSFASIFTGLSPARHGVLARFTPLASERTTLAERFRAGGWATHAILYKPYLYDDGHHQGFDSYFNVPQTVKLAEQNLRKALIWIQKNRERRFFLFLHFDDPHQPLTQPTEFIGEADRARMQALGLALPAFVGDRETAFRDPKTGRQIRCAPCAQDAEYFRALARRLYDGEVAFVDDRIGALLAYLRESGLYDDAVIAFVSDHGETLWDHDDVYGHGNGKLYDGLIHVPLIIKPPAGSGLASARVVTEQVRAFDLMPTLLDLAGIPIDASLDARSLRPLMLEQEFAGPPRVAIAESEWGIAIRHEDAKYMHWGREFREAWFDLANDPAETRDLAATQPEPLSRFRLEAANHYVPTLPGRFVAVTGAPPGAELSVRIAWSAPTRPGRAGAFGLGAPVEAEPATFSFRGEASGGLGFLAHFRPPPGAKAKVEVAVGGAPVRSPEAFTTYDPEALGRAASTSAPQVHLIRGGGVEFGDRTPASLDSQRIEALRALGYLE